MLVTSLQKNQTVVTIDQKVYFQSYESVVCAIDNNSHTITFGPDWNYSKTTVKYLNKFLNGFFGSNAFDRKFIEKMLKTGCYNHKIKDGKSFTLSDHDIIIYKVTQNAITYIVRQKDNIEII